jgi:serine/threonine-protein kinase
MTPRTPITQGRFLPGSLVAGRWRMVSMLGQGGMGEVYRADDLKLGEAVALKFLPERLERDPELRTRFLSEAKLARQVAHPNVCRVYDIGEVDGRPFLSMEYVDGEDLGTLLRRIGRLPHDKAVQIAREMCAGLQAAHEQGILHRDLKPANVMLDGRGHARLTDFGLAVAADASSESDALAGTPAYMAPEQLGGSPPSVATDLYALGLVMYELFAGRPAFEGHDWMALAYLKQNTPPRPPSQVSADIDPLTERAILRCLSVDPALRPADAAALAAALPGGDPLAAAVAAGETPSPEMVAAGTGREAVEVRLVGLLAAGFAIALLALLAIAPHRQLLLRVPLRKPPAVMAEHLRAIADSLGYPDRGDEQWVLTYDSKVPLALAGRLGLKDLGQADERAFSAAFGMFHRSSPHAMQPFARSRWYPSIGDPPMQEPGSTLMLCDAVGRLLYFEGVPPLMDSSIAVRSTPPVPAVMAALGMDEASLQPDSLRVTPPRACDWRGAWRGRLRQASVPGPFHVELAAFRGRIVSARIFPESDLAPIVRAQGRFTTEPPLVTAVGSAVGLLFLALLAFVGYRHVRAGSADVRGSLRVALAVTLLAVGANLSVAHRGGGWRPLPTLGLDLVHEGAYTFGIAFALYLALEPVLRRTWPQVLVSWMRLLEGRWSDARVGRDALAGLCGGGGLLVGLYGVQAAWVALTGHPVAPGILDSPADQTDTLTGGGFPFFQLLRGSMLGLLEVLGIGGGLAVMTVVTRQRWLAIGVAAVLVALLGWDANTLVQPFDFVAVALETALVVWLVVRVGLLAGATCHTTLYVLRVFPLASPGSSWYWPVTAVGLGFLVLMAAWAARAALRGRAIARAHDAPAA